jgi:glycerol-3-phosphate dehydrogenase
LKSSSEYDVVIVGGGINGAGIARDAALRGLTVLLLEQNDFGSGTSSWSSRLIHGGLRYLEYGEIPLVYESLRERRILRTTAKHLVRSLRISIPVYEHSRRGLLTLRAGMIAYDLLSLRKSLPRHRVLDRDEFLRNEAGVNPSGLRGGVQYYDAQVPYAERLVIENVIAAKGAGAVVRNYSKVTGIDVREGGVKRLFYSDDRTGFETEVHANIVVNAAGPWVDSVQATLNLPAPGKLLGGTKGSHIIVGQFEGAPRDAFYVEAQSDGRPFFIIPWNSQFLIGTTDIRYDGDPADARASDTEIRYLISETNRVFPQANLSTEDIHYTYAGVRPLPQRSGPESAITRKHIIMQHRDARGLWTVIGGKLTTYRSLAEDAVDRIVRKAGLKARACITREENLPGANLLKEAEAELQRFRQLTPECRQRMLGVYGGRARHILELARTEPHLCATLDPKQTVIAAEVAFTLRSELATNLIDIQHRRTMTGLAADQGASVAEGIAAAAARELGWTEAEMRKQLDALRAYNAKLSPHRASPEAVPDLLPLN